MEKTTVKAGKKHVPFDFEFYFRFGIVWIIYSHLNQNWCRVINISMYICQGGWGQ